MEEYQPLQPVTQASQGTDIERQAEMFRSSPFAPLIDASPSMIMILDTDRRIVFANREAVRQLGLSAGAEMVGRFFGDVLGCLHLVAEDGSLDRETARVACGSREQCRQCGALQAIQDSQEGLESVREWRGLRQRGDGFEAVELRIKASPFELMGESFTVLAADDVGDEERRRALERIFFHDILNTVGALKGLLQLLRETAPSGLSEDIGLIHAHFAALVEEIQAQRDLTAAEASELVPRMGTASSMQVLDEIKRRFDSSEAAEGRSIVIAEDSQDLVLETDFRLLARILGNMVKNGLEAVGPGETVTLHAGKQEGRVLFAVRNPGVIPPGVQVQIFRRSFSTKGPGRGLGTYGMKLLAERYLGGRVSFGSSPGTGTEFRVALPLASS